MCCLTFTRTAARNGAGGGLRFGLGKMPANDAEGEEWCFWLVGVILNGFDVALSIADGWRCSSMMLNL